MNTRTVRRRLREMRDGERAEILQRFFKTAPGGYGEGDVFLGIRVPKLRGLARQCHELSLDQAEDLLCSPIHEERLLALIIFVGRFRSGGEKERRRIFEITMKNRKWINNWDLVDSAAGHIVGGYLEERDRTPLYRLARSRSLWDRRIAVMATFHFIRNGDFDETLRIVEILLKDKEDLIHKAAGWMLREVGVRNRPVAEDFLKKYRARMPRTMLRYAIEKFPEPLRQSYLKRN